MQQDLMPDCCDNDDDDETPSSSLMTVEGSGSQIIMSLSSLERLLSFKLFCWDAVRLPIWGTVD